MKYITVIILFTIPLISFSQEWRLGSNIGYATGEMKTLKKIMLASDLYLNHESPVGRDYYLIPGAGISSLKFNYSDTGNASVFNSKYFFTVLLAVKKYYPMSKNAKGFVAFGITGSYLFNDKKEYKTTLVNETFKRHGLGYNAGFMISIGYKIEITATLSLDLAITGQADYFSKYKNEADKIKTDNRMIGLSFYKRFL